VLVNVGEPNQVANKEDGHNSVDEAPQHEGVPRFVEVIRSQSKGGVGRDAREHAMDGVTGVGNRVQCLIGIVQLLDIEMWKVPMDTVVEITPMSIQLSGGREVPHGSVQEAMTLQAVHGVAKKNPKAAQSDSPLQIEWRMLM